MDRPRGAPLEATVAPSGVRIGGLWLPRQTVAALAILATALLFAQLLTRTEAVLGTLWLLALGAGFTLQRSRFCFASAFRDLFLLGQSRITKGILVALAIATVGFAIIIHGSDRRTRRSVLAAQRSTRPTPLLPSTAGSAAGKPVTASPSRCSSILNTRR